MTTTTRGTCTTCGGKGYLIRARQIGRGQFVREDETCPSCDGDGGPRPTPPAGALTIDGHTVTAPTFRDAYQFDRAIGRAFADGLTVAATDRPDAVLVVNPTNGASYTTTRHTCSCTAGRRGAPCKHVAYAVLVADVWHALPTPAPVPAAVAA